MGLLDDPAGEIAGLLSSEWISENIEGDLIAISIRLPPARLALVDAMARKAGISRNRMANMLLAAGCKDVVSRLPSAAVEDLHDEIEEGL